MDECTRARIAELENKATEVFQWEDVLSNGGVKNYRVLQNQIEMKCPYHDDKRPSFRIVKDWGIFHCFSCGNVGGIIKLMHALSGSGLSYIVYAEQILKQTEQLKNKVTFHSLFSSEKTLDPEFNKRRTFNKNLHLCPDMPVTVLADLAKKVSTTWETLVFSMVLLQEGMSSNNVASKLAKITPMTELEEKQSVMDVLGVV